MFYRILAKNGLTNLYGPSCPPPNRNLATALNELIETKAVDDPKWFYLEKSYDKIFMKTVLSTNIICKFICAGDTALRLFSRLKRRPEETFGLSSQLAQCSQCGAQLFGRITRDITRQFTIADFLHLYNKRIFLKI